MRRHDFLEDGSGAAPRLFAAALRPAAGWNDATLQAIRTAGQAPLAAVRTLALVHTCMYNAWAAYDDDARQTVHGMAVRLPRPERDAAASAGAMHHAAWTALCARFPAQRACFDRYMDSLGLDPAAPAGQFSPAGIGRVQALSMIDALHRTSGAQAAPFAAIPGMASPVPLPSACRIDDALPERCCGLARHASLPADDRDVLLYFALANALSDAAWAAAGHGAAADVCTAAVGEVLRRFTGGQAGTGRIGADAGACGMGRKIGGRVFDKARRCWRGML
jgi:hypothetical protein